MVDFLLPVSIEMVIQIMAVSFQPVSGTCAFAGDIAKLVRIRSPTRTEVGGTLIALAILWHAY